MLYDDGILRLCKLKETAPNAAMPKEELEEKLKAFFGVRTVGYGRYYAAIGVNQRVDMLIRSWYMPEAEVGMYVVLESGSQYRIDNVQHLIDDDDLRVTDLTLQKMEALYDIAE